MPPEASAAHATAVAVRDVVTVVGDVGSGAPPTKNMGMEMSVSADPSESIHWGMSCDMYFGETSGFMGS